MSTVSDAAAAVEQAEPAEGRFRLQFRVLMIDGARKAFRLESAFWDALEVLSRRNGRSLSAEVEARLSNAPAELNQSSALRASLAGDLLDLWNGAVAKSLRPQWAGVVAALPTPAFVVSRRSVLLAVNEPLLTHLQETRQGRGAPINTLSGAMDLSVETPPSAVAELAGDANRRFVTCSVVFKAGLQRIACRVRLVPIEGPNAETPALLGFVDTRPH